MSRRLLASLSAIAFNLSIFKSSFILGASLEPTGTLAGERAPPVVSRFLNTKSQSTSSCHG
jgi:hypothetical protein